MWLLLLLGLDAIFSGSVTGFVNSPKIISKDGNLIFESGSNRNISIQLVGKSRLIINDEYDVLELLLAAGSVIGGKKRLSGPGPKEEWSSLEDTVELVEDVALLKRRAFGPNGFSEMLRQVQNRTRVAKVLLRRIQVRLRSMEGRVLRLTSQLELDSCKSSPCENGGSCYNTFGGYRCQCRAAFEGSKCELDINECALYAGTDLGCQNGAQCVNQFGSYSCICAPGWYGTHCLQRKGDCALGSAWELCGHGSCVANSDSFGYKCLCDAGWRSNGLTPACTVDVDECSADAHTPCSTRCINLPGSFTCAPCAAGLTGNGISCRDINECETNNGGCSQSPHVDCFNSYGGHQCGECPVGWSGDGRSCMRSSSAADGTALASGFTSCAQRAYMCHPQAACSEISGTVVCTCPPNMIGNGIGEKGCVPGTAANCNGLPCLNGGTCIDHAANYTCLCPFNFYGPRCEQRRNQCAINPCRNGGRCREKDGVLFCDCQPGYRGRLCDSPASSCNGMLTGLTGRLQYPSDADSTAYDHDSQCAWIIRTNESLVLNVTFTNFDVEDATECRFDWLQINDGRTSAAQLIGRFCGRHRPMGGNIISSTNNLYLWFRSDNSTAHSGFALTWESIPPQCGGVIDFETHGTIATPGSPGNYPKNRECTWHLRAPNSKRIKLTFFTLQLEQHADCNFDFVKITDAISKQVLYQYCTTTHPPPLTLPSHEVYVRFHSDNNGTDLGFQLHYSVEERIPGCGGVYTAPADSIKSPVYAAGNEKLSCEYQIQMAMGESVHITFIKFQLAMDDCIEIYDVTNNPSSPEDLLESKHCGSSVLGSNVPPDFASHYRRVKIKYYGHAESVFQLDYRRDCLQLFEDTSGELKSPGYPNISSTERLCTYKVLTEPNTVISLSRVDFQLLDNELLDDESGQNCGTSTSLWINDGMDRDILGPYCGQNLPPADFASKTNMLVLTLRTSTTTHGRGFKFTYVAVPVSKSHCGGIFTKPGQTIRLPQGDNGEYSNDLTCYWMIMAPALKGIMLKWKSFSIEASSDCSYDYVEIYDNMAKLDSDTAIGRYCDLMPPSDIISHSRLITIKFVSDFSETSDGFELTYDFVDLNSCGGHRMGSTGHIVSPDFPLNYTNGIDCKWTITGPMRTQIELQIEMFELEPTTNCSGDWLNVHNGAQNSSLLVGHFCGTRIPKRIPAFTNELFLHFHSDSFVNGRGFQISWRVFSNRCGGELVAMEGVITSPHYPSPYPHNVECEWQVTVHGGSNIHFTIEDLAMESWVNCFYDSLQIFSPDKTLNEPILNVCRKPGDDPIVLYTTSNRAVIVFKSDSSNTERGFRLTYTANCSNTLTHFQGVIESLNFGEQVFDRDVNCHWTIKAPLGNRINIEFSHFERLREASASTGGLYFQQPMEPPKFITDFGFYNVTGNELNIIHNSTAIIFRLEYRIDGCLQILRGETGSFESPNYPEMYPQNMECFWTIETVPGKGIELNISNMDLEPSENCTKDVLIISHHPTDFSDKERHCGVLPLMTITSASHRMYVHFRSNDKHNGHGFAATYRIIETPCGGEMISKNGIIQSPNYPLPYPEKSNCEWLIEVSPHHGIIFELEDIDLEGSHMCNWDYVVAYEMADVDEGRQIFKVCDTNIIDLEPGKTNKALIRFVSDDSLQSRGFKLSFREACGESITIDELTFDYISITKHVPRNETCTWHIIASDLAKRIIFTPTHVSLYPDLVATYPTEGGCMDRGIKIYDGSDANASAIARFCNSHPAAVVSRGHVLTITVPLSLIAEFEGHYMTMDTACGSQYDALKGVFTTPYYPESYPVNIECFWTLEASLGNSIILTFESMNLEQSDGCNNDYVEVRETDERGALLGVYCGNEVPPPIKGKQSIWIKFQSNNDVVGEGFMAAYNYESHNELSGNNGTVVSPRYPSQFETAELYSWRITVDKEFVVVLKIEYLLDINNPYLRFYDGYSDIGIRLDHVNNRVLRTGTNTLYFTAKRGPFMFTWDSLSKEAVRSNNTLEEQTRVCGKELFNVNNTLLFRSPGYPKGYAENLNCTWIFTAINPGMHVVVSLIKIDLESFGDCFADYLGISRSKDMVSWQNLGKICDTTNTTLFHGDPYLKLNFVTDASINKTGFSTYIRTECGSQLHGPQGFVNISAMVSTISLFGQNCTWIIRARLGRRVRITFVESIINSPPRRTENYFIVRNGMDKDAPFLGRGRYTDNITDVLETSSNFAYISFRRTGIFKFRAAFRYEEIRHACSDEIMLSKDSGLDARSSIITSPNFPDLPNPYSECIWKITAPPHEIIAVEFFDPFNLSGGESISNNSCEREYIELNDGLTELMPVLGRFCGKRKPDTVYTHGNMLRLKYYNDLAEPNQGFRVEVKLGRCGGTYYSNEGTILSPVGMKVDLDERNLECNYTIEVEVGSLIRLDFKRVQLLEGNCTAHTHIQLDEMEPFGTDDEERVKDTVILCGEARRGFLVETNKVIVRLRLLDGALKEREGFQLYYTSVGSRCSETIEAVRGILQSPGYPQGVRSPTHCTWRIRVPKGWRVKVNIIDFDPGFRNMTVMAAFGGRLTFANDFQLHSIIGRYSHDPPSVIYSTDNTMAIVAFLLPRDRHRGFKLSFEAASGTSCTNLRSLEKEKELNLNFNRTSANDLVYCNYNISVPENHTMLIEVTNHVSRGPLIFNPIICKAITALKLKLNDSPMNSPLCSNRTTGSARPSMRIPFNVQMEVSGNKRNDLVELALKLKMFPCGGKLLLDMGDLLTVEQPVMDSSYGNDQLECAWAIWIEDYPDDMDFSIGFEQIEVSLNVNFTADCKDQYLTIYNGPDQSSPHLGTYCKQSTADNLVVMRGFFFEYHAEHYETSSTFNVTVKKGSGCGGKITYPYRHIVFKDQYDNNVECVWEIEADPGYTVGLSFLDRFYIEFSNNCTKDYLMVQEYNTSSNDWTDLITICGREPSKSINTTTSAMRVIFRSDGDTLGDGFTAKFDRNCGGLLYATDTSQLLTSPNYPNPYAHGLLCNYTIVPSDSHRQGVLVRFLDFDLETSPVAATCLFDNVTILARNEEGLVTESVLCGMKENHEYRAQTSITLIFRTDTSFTGRGFKLDYSTNLCGGLVTESGIVETPRQHTDNKFPEKSNCYWNLTAPENRKFIIKFEFLDFESSTDCMFDGVSVFQGSVPVISQRMAVFCGNITSKLPIINIPSNRGLIHSYSDRSIPSRGFRALVRVVPKCDDGIAVGPPGNTTYRFNRFFGEYDNNLDCSFVFRTDHGSQLQIEFRSFHVQASQGCVNDYVAVRDGAGPFAEEMGRFCGHDLPPKLISSRRTLYVHFVTDGEITDTGFEAIVTSTKTICGAPQVTLEGTTKWELNMPENPNANYENNIFCFWKIIGQNELHMKFNRLDLEGPNANGSCDADYIKVYNEETALLMEQGYGEKIIFTGEPKRIENTFDYSSEHVYCGSGAPDDYYANTKTIFIKFRSNAAIAKSGFSLTVTQMVDCYRNFSGVSGRIKISLTADMCKISINAPTNHSLSIYFMSTYMPSNNCDQNYLNVYDPEGSSIARLCANLAPDKSIFSTFNVLNLELKLDDYLSTYDMTYVASQAGPGCGGELYNQEGIFTNPFYPRFMRQNFDCRWRVRVSSNAHVMLDFSGFDMGSKSTCHSDYLRILERDEAGEEREMSRYCGEDKPSTYSSMKSELIVHYHQTLNYNGNGWVIKFVGVRGFLATPVT